MWIYLVLAFLGVVHGQDSSELKSPCPELFRYEGKKEAGHWEGVLTLISDTDLYGIWARVLFDSPTTNLTTQNFGEVVSTDDQNRKDYLIKDRDYLLKAGVPTEVKISVKYQGNKVPKLTGFRLNARIVCPETPENTSWLENETGAGCGTVPLPRGSNTNGVRTSEGKWPWHASIYYSDGKEDVYVCGGTLISPNHVLTSAHCVTQKYAELLVKNNPYKIRLGKYLFKSNTKGSQEVGVEKITFHPEYSAKNFANDIAVIKLDKAVRVTPYVRPVCLWEGDDALLSKSKGAVVGWGVDNHLRVTDRLREAQIRAAPVDTCRKITPFTALVSDKTLCATYAPGNAICVGDSGSGLVYLRDGPKPIWQLRGVLYVSPIMLDNFVCNESNAIGFTDVSKYAQWIANLIA